jgi:putative hydrolase of the HAD superfamily
MITSAAFPIRAVLFDLDETLSDRHLSLARFAHAFRDEFASDLDDVGVEVVRHTLQQADGGGYRSRNEVFADLLEALPWRVRRSIDDLGIHWQAVFPRCAVPMAGLDRVLDTLDSWGMRMGIISNGGAVVQNLKVDALHLRPRMDTILVSEAIGIEKPDPLIFRRAVEDLGIGPSDAVYVGDHPIIDVLGAAAAGLQSIWLRRSIPWPDRHPSPLKLDALSALPSLLKSISAASARPSL